ncbi:hypothetical protein EDB83DRAFT_2449903 [Lactarius deliciosus]|nr:hypothetical protein EDB83DRAFT_2449903 [Lactarius deliciosus]
MSLPPYCLCLTRTTWLGAAASWSGRCAGARRRRARVRFVIMLQDRSRCDSSLTITGNTSLCNSLQHSVVLY